MKKILLVDDNALSHWLWQRGGSKECIFLHAYTIQQARSLFALHLDISAIVVDACMDGPLRISFYRSVREWGFNTVELIRDLRKQFTGPIIAAPIQWWHFQLMREAGCSHHCWKWAVPALLKRLLTP